jgi:hypothetical protein
MILLKRRYGFGTVNPRKAFLHASDGELGKIDLSYCKIFQIMMYFCRDKKLHIGFDDPDAFSGHEEQVIEEFRRVRDEIRSEMSKL